MGTALRKTIATGMAILGIALAAGGAEAHSKDKETTPADGTVLQLSAENVGMTSDRPMRISEITLRDAAGDEHALARSDDMTPVTEFEATPATLPGGSYTIERRGLSDDGHPMEGTFSFEIGS
ncbi:hypothetical protein SAMN05444004_11134 [Jannaschia faecimaris]|uniref:CopC domain-containing protein n=1 Tax=Jannaschia faecimaris TaxID=1244108 RepID=A0A1H3SAM6_9RHOB|nr:copper resistance CopC family protein [Jannaschia faecimaris]SDZ34605.1 hypothetical protein SAMN05444004_11134 [Jannaschia faecimaris]